MFYTTVWDPRLIIYQIFAVQCVYYMLLGFFLFAFDVMIGHTLTTDQIFGYTNMNTHSMRGWAVILSCFATAISSGIGLLFIVERSKKCLDHTATAFICHLISVWAYGGFPKTWTWWIVQFFCFIIMVVLGEYLCMRKELRDIPLRGFENALNNRKQSDTPPPPV